MTLANVGTETEQPYWVGKLGVTGISSFQSEILTSGGISDHVANWELFLDDTFIECSICLN